MYIISRIIIMYPVIPSELRRKKVRRKEKHEVKLSKNNWTEVQVIR